MRVTYLHLHLIIIYNFTSLLNILNTSFTIRISRYIVEEEVTISNSFKMFVRSDETLYVQILYTNKYYVTLSININRILEETVLSSIPLSFFFNLERLRIDLKKETNNFKQFFVKQKIYFSHFLISEILLMILK